MYRVKKAISILLALVMLVSLLTVIPAFAEDEFAGEPAVVIAANTLPVTAG